MPWLTDPWTYFIPIPLANALLALVAIACGAIVGSERERREKAAGLRTLILVCLGSELFTMISFILAGGSGDSGRVAAQIVTGIGFLGAGVILHGTGRIVSGTTTAATIWVTAAIGMLAGTGYACAALGVSILVRLLLIAIGLYEAHLAGEIHERVIEIIYESSSGRTRVRLERVLVDYYPTAVAAEWPSTDSEASCLRLRLHLPRRHMCELLSDLVAIPEVKIVR